MKKLLLLITCFVFAGSLAFGGGIVTNSNQSAYWVRSIVRDASTNIDAVYFNPAGLALLNDGFHFSLNSQTIFQSKDVTNNYMFLDGTPKKYEGEIKVPVFPSVYAAYKKNKITVSFGFNPIGGGGGATFKKGLPSFEIPISNLVPAFQGIGATDYSLDAYLKGTSIYFGYQAGVTYEITDVYSVYAGVRYVSAKNTYEGHLRDIQLLIGENWVPASVPVSTAATQAAGAAINVQNAIDGGVIGANDPISASLQTNLIALGIDPTGFTNIMAVGALNQASVGFNAKANLLAGQEVDVVQKGSGICPIIGFNISPSDKLNIALKYEFKTRIKLENDTKEDFTLGYTQTGTPITMFPDGAEINGDIPAMFSVGVYYEFLPRFSTTAGFHYYFDKSADYGKQLNGEYVKNSEVIDKNYFEIGLGLEYGITEKIFVSGGYLYAKPGVSKDYQSEMSYALPSSTVGGGFGIKFSDKIMANIGAAYTKYSEEDKTQRDLSTGQPYTNTFFKSNLIFGVGLDFSF